MPQPSRCSSVRPPRSLKPANEKSRVAGLLLFIASNWHMVLGLHENCGTGQQYWLGQGAGRNVCAYPYAPHHSVRRWLIRETHIKWRKHSFSFQGLPLILPTLATSSPQGSGGAAMQRSHHAISRPEKLSGPFVA